MPKLDPQNIARVESEFSRIGLLLQHDKQLPSVTTLLAGKPIAGSWWGHELGHAIYEFLEHFETGAGALCVKFVNEKLTYVHPRLWKAFLRLVSDHESQALRELSPAAKALRDAVIREQRVRADELKTQGFAHAQELNSAARELELKLLVHATSLHTSSGAHVKQFANWSSWAATHQVSFDGYPSDEASEQMRSALALLGSSAPKLPRTLLLDSSVLS